MKLVLLLALLPLAARAQGVYVLSTKNAAMDTALTVLRNEAGFSACGVQTTLMVRADSGFPAESLSMNLALSLDETRSSLSTMVKVTVNRMDAKTKSYLPVKPSVLWVGPASESKPFRVESFQPSPVSVSHFIGVGDGEGGWKAILALAVAQEPVQLQVNVKGDRVQRVLQFTPPRLSLAEFNSLSACLSSVVEVVRKAPEAKEPSP